MGVTITVDLGTSSPKDIARAAKFMLEFAGYQEPSSEEALRAYRDAASRQAQAAGAATGLVGARGSLGEPIDDNGPIPDPAAAFGGTHGSPELDADATKLREMGADPGPKLHDYPMQPPAPAATLPPPPPGIEVDAHGVPWDNRIHAGSRAKIADGTWRQKRNLDPEVYKKVMDELRHTMGVERRAPQPPAPPVPQEAFAPHPPVPPIPVVPAVPPAPFVETAASNAPPTNGPVGVPQATGGIATSASHSEVPPAPFVASATPPAPPISTTPPVPVSAGAAPAASPGSPVTFPELMKKITAAFAAKTITQADITRAVQKVKLTALPMLASRPDLVADVATELGIAL